MDDKQTEQEKLDKLRIGGNHLQFKHDLSDKNSGFYVMISGHIESGQINEYDGMCAKFDFIAGTEWNIIEGNRTGVSQHAYKSQQTNRRVVWNYPFEIAFKALNVNGWP